MEEEASGEAMGQDITSLPSELIHLTFTLCSYSDLVNALLVCKRWQAHILASTDFGNPFMFHD